MNPTNLSRKVKELRIRRGFSQEELAEKAGLSLRTIQRIENGETDPRGDSLRRLTAALDSSPDELIDWTMEEDKGILLLLHTSALSFLLFPILGIIAPLIIWTSKKDKIKKVNEIGGKIINFQITWSILLFLTFFALVVLMILDFDSIQASGNISADKVSVPIRRIYITYIWFSIYNVLFIAFNLIRAHKNRKPLFYPVIKFIR